MSPATKGAPIQIPSGWSLDDEGRTIGLHLKTKDFMSAIGVMNEVAMAAEELDHHPDFHLTGWNRLEIRTYTHTKDALTENDRTLAERINEIVARHGIKPQ